MKPAGVRAELIWLGTSGSVRLLRRVLTGIRNRIFDPLRCWFRFGFFPPPPWSDLTGYRNNILEVIDRNGICHLQGDVVEIGTFLGGGTYYLSRYFGKRAPEKKVIAVDIFNPSVDATVNVMGRRMSDMYAGTLSGRSQRAIFDDVTRGCGNLLVIAQDSMGLELPTERVCFSYIDGNHDPRYVRSDFSLVWCLTIPRGWVAFDDYGEDLPEVTETINRIIGERADEIARVVTVGSKTIFLQKKALAVS